MIRKAAVLAYPNSNNLGDYIQSIAAKQLISKEDIIRLDRDHLNIYFGERVTLLMNGRFMESSTHWHTSNQLTQLFISFHLNSPVEKGMLTHI